MQKYLITSFTNFSMMIPLRIRFNKIDGFIRVYDETRYLVLFGTELTAEIDVF